MPREVPGGVSTGTGPRRELGPESEPSQTPNAGGLGAPHEEHPPYETGHDGPAAPSRVNSGPTQLRNAGGAVATKDNRLVLPYGEVRVQGVPWRPVIHQGPTAADFFVAWGAGPIEEITSLVPSTLDAWPRTDLLGTFDNSEAPMPDPEGDSINAAALLPFVAGSIVRVGESNTEDVGDVSANIKGRLCYDARENRFIYSSDFTGAYWFSNYAGPTVSASAELDPWCGTDASLLEFPESVGPNDWYRNYTVATVSGQHRTAEVWIKAYGPAGYTVRGFVECVNVSGGLAVQTKKKTFYATTDRWYKLKSTLASTTTGDLISLVISFESVPAGGNNILVFNAGLSLKRFSGGSVATAASEVVPVYQYTDNLALVALDVICSCVDAGNVEGDQFPMGANNPLNVPFGDDFNPTKVDVESFCEAARTAPSVAIVFSEKMTLDQALSRLRMAGLCDIYFHRGRLRIDIDSIHCEGPEIQFASNTPNDPLYPNNCKDVVLSRVPAIDRPTRVSITFPDRNANWTQNTVASEDPGIQAGTVPLRDAQYSIDGIATVAQAMTVASWIRRVSKRSLRVQFNCSPVGVLLRRFQRIRLRVSQLIVQNDGTTFFQQLKNDVDDPWQDFLVTTFERLADGTFSVSAREYNDDLYDVDDSADGDVVPPEEGPGAVPPVVQPVCDSSFNVSWQPARNYKTRELYLPADWSQTDVDAWDDTKINDAAIVVAAADFAPAANSKILLTLPAAKKIGGLRIDWVADPTTLSGPWNVYADGVLVTNGYKRADNAISLDTDPGYWHEWDVIEATTFELRKDSTTAGTEEITELQYREFDALYDLSDHVLVVATADNSIVLETVDVRYVTGTASINLATHAATSIRASDGKTIKTLDVCLINCGGKRGDAQSIPVRVVHTEEVLAIDTPQKPRMLRVDHATGIARWQRPIYHKGDGGTTATTYGAAYWTATNYSAFTAAAMNDGVTNVTAVNPNAAGATDITLSMPGAGVALAALQVTFNGSQPIIGYIDQFEVQYRAVAGSGAWTTVDSYIATIGTTAAYTPFTQVATFATHDAYVISATAVRFEWDWRDIGTPEEWRLHQKTSASINLPITEIRPLEFLRWNNVTGFVVWAGLYGTAATITNGAAMNLWGKSPGYVPAGAPSLTEFSIQSNLFDAGPYGGTTRRTDFPGVFRDSLGDPDPLILESGNVLGYLYEVTVKSVGDGIQESTSRYAWDHLRSTCVGTSL